MWPVFTVRETLVAIGIVLLLVLTSIRVLQPLWWSSRPVRVAIFVAFATMLVGVTLWSIGTGLQRTPLVLLGARIAYVGVLVLAPAALTLPFAALLNRLLVRVADPSPWEPAVPVASPSRPTSRAPLTRRAFIHAGSASLPALAAVTSARGLVTADDPPRMPVIPMRFDDLHPDLEGLRILQLSDLHLGACAGLADLAKALDAVMALQRPDLIVLTGDLADDPALITGALELVARANARHGALASLGNHEYLHSIDVTRPLYEASSIPLLVSAGRTLTIGRAKLFIGGADDPVHMKGDIASMLRPSIERAAAHAGPDADFRLLLCHRPEGFGPAAELGFDLTLSGHTHGGQLGLFGRSIFETLMPGIGWWGTYARPRRDPGSPSRLYTTSGFGHWFPFRIGCPTEMPLIVLGTSRSAGRASLSRTP